MSKRFLKILGRLRLNLYFFRHISPDSAAGSLLDKKVAPTFDAARSQLSFPLFFSKNDRGLAAEDDFYGLPAIKTDFPLLGCHIWVLTAVTAVSYGSYTSRG